MEDAACLFFGFSIIDPRVLSHLRQDVLLLMCLTCTDVTTQVSRSLRRSQT